MKYTAMKKSGVTRYPSFIEASYSKYLLSVVAEMNAAVVESIINNPYFQLPYNLLVKKDDDIDDIEQILEKLKNRLFSTLLGKIISKLPKKALEVSKFNLRSIANATPSLVSSLSQLNTKATRDLMHIWVIENARLIKSIHSMYLDNVAVSVYEAVKSGKTIGSLAKDLHKAYDITQSRAKLIAADQIAKLNGALTRERKLELGLVNYIWATAKDERVRISHKVLEGLVCDFDNKTVYKQSINDTVWKKRASIGGDENHPGQAIRCRCTSYSVYA